MTTESLDGANKVVDIAVARRTRESPSTEPDAIDDYEVGACYVVASVLGTRLGEVREKQRLAEERAATARRLLDQANDELARAMREVDELKREAAELLELKLKSQQHATRWRSQWHDLRNRWTERANRNVMTRPKLFALLGIGCVYLVSDVQRAETAGILLMLIGLTWLARHLAEDSSAGATALAECSSEEGFHKS